MLSFLRSIFPFALMVGMALVPSRAAAADSPAEVAGPERAPPAVAERHAAIARVASPPRSEPELRPSSKQPWAAIGASAVLAEAILRFGSIAVASSGGAGRGALYVPVAGPFVALATVPAEDRPFMGGLAAGEVVCAVLGTIGFFGLSRAEARERGASSGSGRVHAALVPAVTPGRNGIVSLQGTF